MNDDSNDRPTRGRSGKPGGRGKFAAAKGGKPAGAGERPAERDRAKSEGHGKRGFSDKERSRDGRPGGAAAHGKRPWVKAGKPQGRTERPQGAERAASRDTTAPDGRDSRGRPRTFDKTTGTGKKGDDNGRPGRFQRDFDNRGGASPRSRPRPAGPPAGPAQAESERIAKRLARAGIASRRDAEALIAAGRIRVNGEVLTSPAFNVSPQDVIHLDGTEIPAAERTRLFLFHKPAGVVTTSRDPEGRKTVFDLLPAELPRLMTVGRLDINTEGLLLLTNDGGLARVLELPATGWLRRYRARVHGKVDEKALADLAGGIAVGGIFYGAVEASLERTQGSNAWLTVGLREGKNREVKNILGALDLEVTRLIRVSYGPFQLGDLPESHVLEIKGRTLRDQLGERLIEESGANFEAEIARPFSNRPVRREEARKEESARPKVVRDGDRRPIGEGGLIKARKRRESSRDEALGKLSTRREQPVDKPAFDDRRGGKARHEARPLDSPGQRRANVWMAPGARPQGKTDKGLASSSRPRGGPKGRPRKPKKQ